MCKTSQGFQTPQVKRKATIDEINSKIKKNNEKGGETVPVYMNLLGVRTNKYCNTSHRFKEWREDDVGHKLHLTSSLKCHAAYKLVDYFGKQPKI